MISAADIREAMAKKLEQLQRAERARKEIGSGLAMTVAPVVGVGQRQSALDIRSGTFSGAQNKTSREGEET